MAMLRTGAFARRVGISERSARIYGDTGLVRCERDSSGDRLFSEGEVEKARKLVRLRTAKSGQRASAA